MSEKRFAVWLFIGVFASRALTSTSAYFGDALLYLGAIHSHTYVIQAPGYWLFNRTAALFPNPEIGIAIMNWLFSAGGAVVLYLATRKLTSENVARVAAIAYASIFFAWFSGNIHSPYASQLFFPIAVFLFLLHYREDPNPRWLIAAGALFALGTGFRPSDGVFFAPVLIYCLSKARWTHALACVGIIVAICPAWLVPQQIALAHVSDPVEKSTGGHLANIASGILASGFSLYALANVLRYVLPLGLALFPLLVLILRRRADPLLWLWILPGSIFFLLVYVSDAPYLDYLVAPFLILAATNTAVPAKRKVFLFVACAAVNLIFYLGCRPITFSNPKLQTAEYLFEADLGKYTWYDLQHHYQPLARDLLHLPAFQRKRDLIGDYHP
jgi:4-amino-4-deoxy-L-arabinose transferase-like glycosyltransferase